ncbi:MAG: hypothetical protein WC292_02130 [Clostridia bacterium]
MTFKKSMSIFLGNIDTLFKVLLYSFVLILICLAVLVAIIRPIVGGMFNALELADQLQETVNTWLEGGQGSFGKFFSDIGATFSDNSLGLWNMFFIVMLFYALFKFFLLLTYIPLSKVLCRKMSESYTEKFYAAFVGSLGKSLLFALLHTLMTVAIDAAILLGGYYLFKFIYSAFKILSLTIVAFAVIILFSLKTTMLNQWVPNIVCGKKEVFPALRSAFPAAKRSFSSIFSSVLALYIMLFGLIASTWLSSLGVVPIIAVASFMVLENAVGLTTYFKDNNLKFYTDEIEIESH